MINGEFVQVAPSSEHELSTVFKDCVGTIVDTRIVEGEEVRYIVYIFRYERMIDICESELVSIEKHLWVRWVKLIQKILVWVRDRLAK